MSEQNRPRTYKELEDELRKYKEIVTMFSNTVMGGVAKMSADDMSLLNATEGYYRMTGYTKEESFLPPFSNCGLNLVIPEDMNALMDKVQILLNENQSIRADYRIRKKDGSIAWNSAFCSSVQEQDGLRYIDVFFLDTTEEKNAQLQLSSLIDNMTNGLVRLDVRSGVQILYANNEFYRQMDYSPEEFSAEPMSNDYLKIVHPEDCSFLLEHVQTLLQTSQQRETVDFRILTKNGKKRWIRANISRLYEELPGESLLQCVLTDITRQREQEKQNLLNEERFRIISEQTRDVVFDWNIETDTLHYSPVYVKMFGCPPPSSISTKELLEGTMIYEEDKPIIEKMLADIRASVPYVECKLRLRAADGSYFWALHRVTAIHNADSRYNHVVGIISDVNDLMENALDMQRKADHDLLTGLLNRTAGQRIIEAILEHPDSGIKYAFMQFDIDRFKQLNDFMGHAAGDLALQQIAQQMTELFCENTILIRMGGDEFAIFLPYAYSHEQLEHKIQQFLQTVCCEFMFEEKIHPLSLSLGAAVYPVDGQNFQMLYEHADSAMYQAKRCGRNRYAFYRFSS